MTFPRCALALAAGLLGASLATPPAHAAQRAEPQLSAVLTLADRSTTTRLHRLASQRPSATRVRALAPERTRRDAVLAFARRTHLSVVRADDWSVTVTGPASVIKPALAGPLPSGVASVVGLDDRRIHRTRHRPRATPDGVANPQTSASLRAHYDVPTTWKGAGLTVGVLNLAGWNQDDLKTYADHEGIPLDPDQITTVEVGADAARLDGFGGEYEVALDAEAVLGAAPEADQRLYFAPNTSAGVVSGLEQIASDAEAGLVQVVSTSWGSCERDVHVIATESDRAAYGMAIDRIVAAGATVFAASGDAGAYDCGYPEVPDDEAQVDFPASYPNVVAVGGTTIGAGQPEAGWSDHGYFGYLGDGSGGGESVEQPLPSYQSGLVPEAGRRLVPDVSSDADPRSGLGVYVRTQGGWSSAGGTSLASPTWAGMLASAVSAQGRTTGLGNILPALYALALDPERHGFADVTAGNNGLFTATTGYDRVTGLGVPVWSELGPELLASGPGAPATGERSPVSRPPRSAEPTLTASYTRTLTAPVRVSVPQGASYTGFSAGELVPGCAVQEPTVPTTASLLPDAEQGEHEVVLTGFDTARVCHQQTATVIYDSVKPTATVTAELVSPSSTNTRLRLGGTDATSGIGAWDVSARDDAGRLVYYAVSPSRAPVISAFRPGGRYTVRVRAHDRAGNVSGAATTVVTIALDDTAFSRSGSWTRFARSQDFGGTHLGSQQPGAALTLTTLTRRVDGYFLTGPDQGYVDVFVDGRRTTRLDLYAATTSVYRPILGRWSSVGAHTLKLVATGTHRAASRGSLLSVDGVLELR